MALILKWMYRNYVYVMEEHKDERSEDLPLMVSPIPLFIILTLYLYFVKSLGPRLMRDTKPFDLQSIMIVYNMIQVVLNLVLGVLGARATYFGSYSLRCENLSTNLDATGFSDVFLVYCYFVLKLLDLLDTIFFVLRKKWNQISFLHLYHHIGICFGAWLSTRFFPGGHGALLGVINCFVHVFMYFYYFLTAFKPELKTSIWWKKYITQIQIIQFLILTAHFFIPLLLPVKGCTYPKTLLFIAGLQNLFMLFMFSDFYYKAYLKKKQS